MIRTRLTYTALTLAVLGLLVGAAACGASGDIATTTTTNQNPRLGKMVVWAGDDVTKRCDGTTLVYELILSTGPSIAVVPSSPECTH